MIPRLCSLSTRHLRRSDTETEFLVLDPLQMRLQRESDQPLGP